METVSNQIKNCLVLQEKALEIGCSKSSLIWAQDIIFDPRVTLKCRQNLCTHYNKNYMCPPFVPTWKEYVESTSRYRIALLLQIKQELEFSVSQDEVHKIFDKMAINMNRILLILEKYAFKMGFKFSMSLGGGNCKLCDSCAAVTGKACIRPNEARPSMEAAGIDVIGTCDKYGIDMEFNSNYVSTLGLLFVV